MAVLFSCTNSYRVIITLSNEPNRNMAEKIQESECDKHPSELRKIDGFTTIFSSFCGVFCTKKYLLLFVK